jgi:protein SCO1/2
MIRSRLSGRVPATALILVAAAAAALGLWLGARVLAPEPPALVSAVLYPQPRALPAFTLSRSDGQPLTLEDWKGHWTIAYFGYTNCPDVCPMTLGAFKQAWQQLAPATRARLRFDFISVDPARDTPEQLGRYVAFFDPSFVGATGSDEELTRLSRALGLAWWRGEPENGTYAVDHSAYAVIIDPAGHQVGLLKPPFEPARIAADLETLVGSG